MWPNFKRECSQESKPKVESTTRDKNFKVTMLKMLSNLVDKLDNMHE